MLLYTATRILQAQKEYLQDKKHLPKVNEEKLKEATETVMEIVNFLNLHGVRESVCLVCVRQPLFIDDDGNGVCPKCGRKWAQTAL